MQPGESDDLDSVSHWYFAVGGLQTQQGRIEINRAISLRRLTGYPRPADLALSLRDLSTAGCMASYGEESVQHELVFDAGRFSDYEEILLTAGLVIGALRIRTGAEVFCPAVCERSWGTLAGMTGNRCLASRVEQVMRGHKLATGYAVSADDLAWVGQVLGPLYTLTADTESRNEQVATAVEALCSYLHAANYRMMTAQLWAGIEALFDVQHEISYRIALLVAFLLEPQRGPACQQLFEDVRELYKERSKAVHGSSKMTEAKLAVHVARVRNILARLLARIVELKRLPSEDEIESGMFLSKGSANSDR